MKKQISYLSLSAFVMASLVSSAAFSGTVTGSLAGSVSITSACTVSSAGWNLPYDSTGTNQSTDASTNGTIVTFCTAGTPSGKIRLDAGLNPEAGSTDAAPLRRVANGASFLNYNIFQDDLHATVWGNTDATGIDSPAGSGSAQNTSFYVKIPAGQTTIAGNYADTVQISLDFT